MREQPDISIEYLRACLEQQYNVIPIALEYLPLGLDYNAGVYHVVSEQDAAYLLKVTSRPLYEPQCLVPRYLNDQGITSVVAPVPTTGGALWTSIDEWTVIVYPFIDGDTSWTGMTDEQWKQVGTIFQQIHRVMVPSEGFELLRKETFDPSEYTRWVHAFESQHAHEQDGERPWQRALRSCWMSNRSTIYSALAILETLGNVLQRRSLPYVICHADLHPANLLRDGHGRVFVIDWDEVMLAPKERDFLFVKISSADSETLPGTPAFFQGYDQTEIDWTALTYYRYERVVQDLIACAQEVFFRDDLGEETKRDSFKLFEAILAEGGEIDAASQASSHLPSDLIIPTRMISQIERELAEREKPDA